MTQVEGLETMEDETMANQRIDEGTAPSPAPIAPAATAHRDTERPRDERFDPLSLADLEAMRMLLHGSSVIDWHQLGFAELGQVHRFLRVNEFDPESPHDMERLEELRAEAVDYLTRHFGYRIPEEVAETLPATELFLIASRRGRFQTYACIVLKVMHVLQHLDGRETLFCLPVSDDQVFGLVEAKVVQIVDEMRAAGLPIVEFAWSRKERDSLITKLLAKRETLAAHVYDKLRFRLITKREEDLPMVLRELLSRLVPFNYVIPGQTVNKLLPFGRIFDVYASARKHQAELQPADEINLNDSATNDFSSATYRVINFVADLPVRVGAVLRHVNRSAPELDERAVVYVLTEFQVMDAQSAVTNEQGDSSHVAYKERQQIQVKARLTRGMKSSSNGQKKP
ncbi:MAG: TIGR04552 family protein [Polyangia bacterium]